MRDYVKTWWWFIHFHVFNDDGGYDVNSAITGGSVEERQQRYDFRLVELYGSMDPTPTVDAQILQDQVVYFSLDKPNMARLFWLLQDYFWYNAITGVAGDNLPALTNQIDSPETNERSRQSSKMHQKRPKPLATCGLLCGMACISPALKLAQVIPSS
jgi:hypothetical protein